MSAADAEALRDRLRGLSPAAASLAVGVAFVDGATGELLHPADVAPARTERRCRFCGILAGTDRSAEPICSHGGLVGSHSYADVPVGVRLQVPACDRCSQGVMDSTNPHLLGTCSCECHGEVTHDGP